MADGWFYLVMNKIMRYTFIATFAFLSTVFSPISLMAQSGKGLGFPCYSNQFKLELTTTKTSITTCNDTVQLSVSSTGNPQVYWTDGYYGSSRVVSSNGVFQAYAYDSAFNCVDTTASVAVTVNDAYVNIYSGAGTNPTKLCEGNYVTLYAYSTAPVKWNTGDSTNTILVTKGGKYRAISTSINGCSDTSEFLEVIVNKVKSLTIKANSDTIICLGDTVELELTTKYGYNNMYWNPYYNTSRIVKIVAPGTINVFALDSATSCGIKSNSIQVKVLTPSVEPLCMVTVDSATGKNKLIWKVTPNQRTAYYNIYRESNFAGEFDLIGDADLTNAGTFLDTQVNPKQRPFTYYIDAIDSCNNRAEYSKYYAHTTLHLTANLGVNGENNLNWSDYVGIYPLNTYIIYRSNNSGKFTAIASVAATVKSFSDLTPPSGKNRYYIGIKGQTACDTTGNTLSVNSNMVALGLLSTQDIKKQGISISPNPCSDFLEIQLGAVRNTALTIYNAQGSVVRQIQVSGESQTRIQVSELPAGVYWINDAMGRSSKFIKE
jgi:hypothetical protein